MLSRSVEIRTNNRLLASICSTTIQAMHSLQAAAALLLVNYALAAQFTKTAASVGHPFLKYDAFLFDGLGTLHDNVHARPYAPQAIEALQLAGKLVIIGSNAPHPNDDERELLQRLGVTTIATSLEYAKLNDDVPMVTVFTSGHVAREELRKPSCCFGDRPLVLGASREELGRLHPPGDQIRPVESLEEATCLMAYSSAPTTEDFELAQRAGEMGLLPGARGRLPAWRRSQPHRRVHARGRPALFYLRQAPPWFFPKGESHRGEARRGGLALRRRRLAGAGRRRREKGRFARGVALRRRLGHGRSRAARGRPATTTARLWL